MQANVTMGNVLAGATRAISVSNAQINPAQLNRTVRFCPVCFQLCLLHSWLCMTLTAMAWKNTVIHSYTHVQAHFQYCTQNGEEIGNYGGVQTHRQAETERDKETQREIDRGEG